MSSENRLRRITRVSKTSENGNGSVGIPINVDLEGENASTKKQKCSEGIESEAPSSKKAKMDSKAGSKKVKKIDSEAEIGSISLSIKKTKKTSVDCEGHLTGERFIRESIIPEKEARKRWPQRYNDSGENSSRPLNNKSVDNGDTDLKARCHYSKAEIDGCIYNLYDDVYVKAEEGQPDYIGRIVEFFEATDRKPYFTARWFFKAEDTVIKNHAAFHDQRRVFFSDLKDANLLECIISKINIVQIAPNVDLEAKGSTIPNCDFYYDMAYSIPYSTFVNLPAGNETSSAISNDSVLDGVNSETKSDSEGSSSPPKSQKSEMTLLDLYSGCGGMSTGLCLGAKLSNVNLVTRWAVDLNEYACKSLQLNHPETQVRNEEAGDFLALLKEWKSLCERFSVSECTTLEEDDEECDVDNKVLSGEFEVGKLVGICYGDPNKINKRGLMFKVRWKGYGPSEDTWEPVDGLSKCQERIMDFVRNGYRKKILPLCGDVDVICGGPPCQGISGFNRFRNYLKPLEDEKNKQMVVFMDIVDYLKPKYVLMENVVDILKFAGGYLGRYALSRLVYMNYQARLGMMAAGWYGLPQFRMRAFLWGALPTEKLPQYPLPTHHAHQHGGVPQEFERNLVGYNEGEPLNLENALTLGDAISDLPPVENDETRDEMPYGIRAKTEFQRYIRSIKPESADSTTTAQNTSQRPKLFDHRPYQCNEDDYLRVCQIPKKKGANFRDLPGVLVGPNKIVEWDKTVERVLLPSGKPLVPDYAMSFVKGKSKKPFGRLWWDQTVPTVVTRPEPHNQRILHPEQDRVLSIRENARLQGFPDYYKLFGPVKERYIQVGNAVAVPVARALGYALGFACQKLDDNNPLMTLPPKFPQSLQPGSSGTLEDDAADVVE
ncbi:DNA (cytosine-5)-methyltransferase CMT3-like [Tasmannia lanceolata]|uniref:DNA (cytosine-5)-methyltransferase CMT3-like n=1 Tax=Tasmannia lanceolata TaxID=3420 RepID=UPI0040628A51